MRKVKACEFQGKDQSVRVECDEILMAKMDLKIDASGAYQSGG